MNSVNDFCVNYSFKIRHFSTEWHFWEKMRGNICLEGAPYMLKILLIQHFNKASSKRLQKLPNYCKLSWVMAPFIGAPNVKYASKSTLHLWEVKDS